ncbi:hypothetical protein S83_056247 [Arachis hypogaea]
MHAIVFCPEILQIWNSSPVASTIPRDPNIKAWDWWSQFMEAEKSKPNFRIRSAQVAYLLWQIWLARNALVFEDQRQEPGKILPQAILLEEEYRRHHFLKLPSL